MASSVPTIPEEKRAAEGSETVMPLLPLIPENAVSVNFEPSTSKKLEYEMEEEEKCSLRECGIDGCRPAFIQGCASIKSFTFFCCVLVTVQVNSHSVLVLLLFYQTILLVRLKFILFFSFTGW